MQAKARERAVAGQLRWQYNVVMAAIRFEWDARKSESNARKHGVTFQEAQSAFADPNGKTIDDPDYSNREARFILLGFS